MQIGVQYYRPPFPEEKYWKEDLKNIRAAGFNTLQLWVLWSWVEARPGTYDFADYDRLVSLAEETGLKVVLSAIAEVQPLWIHREIPGSEMVNHLGHKVVSTNRTECHFGVSPGACFDHPQVWERMQSFFQAVVGRYKKAQNLYGWDAWNELRWNVHAQGLVCFCEHTMKYFREWLGKKYGGLDGLNSAWKRRYVSWDDVTPGWSANRPFTEAMAFQHFLTERANEHARKRYETIKTADAVHPVTMHGGAPTLYYCGEERDGSITTPMDRCNDWDLASCLDGIGCSSFPKWGQMDWADYAVRMEVIRSAAGKKRLWLSELQGGRAGHGFSQQGPVRAVEQQHWLWNGVAAGAETILFWCWKDEVFTTEAGGFGVSGFDGYAAERLAAFKATSAVLAKNKDVFDEYRPSRPEIGVYFSPQSFYLHWCNNKNGGTYMSALHGYCKALIRKNIQFEMVEEKHLDDLRRLKVLFMPRTLVVDKEAAVKLLEYVSGGGTLVTESECGAFDECGIYHYPDERFLGKAGIRELGRRTIEGETALIQAAVGGRRFALSGSQWLTPFAAKGVQRWAGYGKDTLAGEMVAGKGRIIMLGTYLGETYHKKRAAGLEDFLKTICERSGFRAALKGSVGGRGEIYIREGTCAGTRVFFVFCESGAGMATIRADGNLLKFRLLRDLVSGKVLKGALNKKKNETVFRFRIPEERILMLAGA